MHPGSHVLWGCDSASITSNVLKWCPLSIIFNRRNKKLRAGGGDSHVVFGQCSLVKKEVWDSVSSCNSQFLSPKFWAKS
jgi:hypothetical protein